MHPYAEALLRWYDENAREMPWRGIQNPYGTWVSEIMLQQTRVDTVRDYYLRFLERFPTLAALAAAKEEEVLKMWEGLGYYSRARNLHAGARQVMAEFGGELPRTPEELRRIKGIGPYTSCSIASIAFGVPVAAVDGNVIRVVCRLWNLEGNPSERKVREQIESLARELVPAERAGDHNQAMMDLGATVCVPGTPDCERCPLARFCAAREAGNAEELPRIPAAAPPREKAYEVGIFLSGDRVLLRRREETLLQGMWCFPMTEGFREGAGLGALLRKAGGEPGEGLAPAGEARHVFTHQVWRMKLYSARLPEGAPAPEGYTWIPPEELARIPLPTAMRAARKVMESKAREASGIKKSSLTENNGENQRKQQ